MSKFYPAFPHPDYPLPSDCRLVAEVDDRNLLRHYLAWNNNCEPGTGTLCKPGESALIDESGLFAVNNHLPSCPCPPSWTQQYRGWQCRAFPIRDEPRDIAAWFEWAKVVVRERAVRIGRTDPEFGWGPILSAARRLANRHRVPGCCPVGAPLPPTREEAEGEVLALADAFHELTANPPSDAPRATSSKTTKKTKGKDIDARMLKMLTERPETLGWFSWQWAEYLGCGEGTVRGTKTWTERIRAARSLREAERREMMESQKTGRRRS